MGFRWEPLDTFCTLPCLSEDCLLLKKKLSDKLQPVLLCQQTELLQWENYPVTLPLPSLPRTAKSKLIWDSQYAHSVARNPDKLLGTRKVSRSSNLHQTPSSVLVLL